MFRTDLPEAFTTGASNRDLLLKGKSMSIVLASASPRRRELLEMLGVENLKIIPAAGEETFSQDMSPYDVVCSLSLAKAREVSLFCIPADVIIAADTIVVLNGKIMGKPRDKTEASEMLKALSGNTHEVFTGVTVMSGKTVNTEYERTLVRFRNLNEREILSYIETKEPMDKAGAYGAQGIGSLFVEGIEGDFFNVMGLPLCRLSKMLEKLGVRFI